MCDDDAQMWGLAGIGKFTRYTNVKGNVDELRSGYFLADDRIDWHGALSCFVYLGYKFRQSGYRSMSVMDGLSLCYL